MNGFRLPEYDPDDEHQRLHVLLRLPQAAAADFPELLRQRWPDVELRYDAEQEVLLAIFPEAVDDHQALLIALSGFLDLYGAERDGGRPDLLETRLAAVDGEEVPAPPVSRHLRLVGDEMELVTEAEELGLALEHGTTFGSGRHPSTRLALRGLDRLYETVRPFPEKMIDVGCGSGILALAGARFGALEVLGLDISAESVALAEENARRNRLAERVRFADSSLKNLAASYDLLAANLSGAVLSGMVDDFARLVRRPGGWLVVSGLQGRQMEEIGGSLAARGFEVVEVYREGNWRGALLAAAAFRP